MYQQTKKGKSHNHINRGRKTIWKTPTHDKTHSWTWKDLGILILSEVSQTQKDKYNMISLIMWNLFFFKGYKWTYKTDRVTDIENKLMVVKGVEGKKRYWETGIDIYTLFLLLCSVHPCRLSVTPWTAAHQAIYTLLYIK